MKVQLLPPDPSELALTTCLRCQDAVFWVFGDRELRNLSLYLIAKGNHWHWFMRSGIV